MVELWAHQKIAIERARNLPSFALHFGCGTGKTLTAIEIMKHRFNTEKRIMRTLIFTPPIVVESFRQEWFKYSKIDKRDVVALTGSAVQRIKTFLQHAYNEKGERRGKVFITNYEAIRMPLLYEAFKKWSPEVSIQDESHKLKNPSSKTAKLLDELLNKYCKPSLRLNLTGTAILNSPMDLFMQFRVLMGGFPTLESLVTGKHTTNFFQFRAMYFEDANAGFKGRDNYYPNWRPRPSTNEIFGRLLSSVSMAVNKEDCLSLPPEVDVTIPTPLSKEQRKDYDNFARDMVLNIEGNNYTAEIAMVKALRLMQIGSGFISGLSSPDSTEAQPIKFEYKDTEREKALRYLLEEICIEQGKKTLVWAVWSHNYTVIKRICDELKIKYVECTGEISAKGKEEARKSFIENPDIKVWLGHPVSGGVGVTLTVAHYAIWYSRNFSREAFEQAKSRSHRGGQTHKVTNYHLVAQDTLEPEILEALKNKQDISEVILSKTNIYKNK